MRYAALALLLGALAGCTIGLALVYAWFELLGLPAMDDDPKGIGTAVTLIGPAILLGAVVSPIAVAIRRGQALSNRRLLIVLGVLAAPSVLLCLSLMI
jgi:hypothetical protein